MTTLGEKFREAAQKSVLKFSTGTYEYKEANRSYNPDTGAVSKAPVSVQAPAARYNISDEKRSTVSYSEQTCIVVMAGLDLGTTVPKVGGIVVFPDATEHRVIWIEPDQYGAAYIMHVTVTSSGS